MSSSSDEDEAEWVLSSVSSGGDDINANERGEDGVDQAAPARKRKAPAKQSSYRGVYFQKDRWRAAIRVDGQQTYLGLFDSEEAAARAYDERAKETRSFPVLNFLPDGSLNPNCKKRGSKRVFSGRPALPDPGRPSIYRGVYFAHGRWQVEIRVNGKKEHLGVFDSEAAAGRAYDERAKEARGFPVLNFLPDGSLNPKRKAAMPQPVLPEPGRVSIYRGVRFFKGRWQAQIAGNGQLQYLGRFDTEEAAARAYDARAKETHGSPILNFLRDGSLNPNRKKRGTKPGGQRRAASATAAAQEDERTVAIEEETEQETGSGGSRRLEQGVMAMKKEEEDERTVAIKEEKDERTVAIKEENTGASGL